ncbi:DeoR/GlpR family DNA-binding transcription regulator [Liquorilactobacillus satsumensis]|uniref:Transcriptional regulator, DeoR family n=1 Tax=Liquorilactobacillus satsumensis DSM 16230 = JCM 12392 TaxID=1423801 RepID=A0A0R1VA98_9LACO|nr:DeoR/GlpR family DNA-binding transcription regulator [Liquorilactobacillus satsumensis]KRL98843.1 transcriptional regulator, DeoR family [Liquorilactobacillus satsumensis DSM 16230 = JCM 12392]MCC7666323.1 DeoR/GlpR transcriptional regulator [Liquorilactobacillus satsumensis]MCP9312759.1 DeoR/GlpR transcriptional regulator [Liquorilactobacillus satsumensis]MCP9327975.1 DeoR/GlpR transcriptional regulator [Liquorilactobacillus satsumensis]MCP9358463.1 DeoR/GlpR transcriptional regulator [Liq
MSQAERLVAITALLKKRGKLSTRFIAQYFNVSRDTARRDIVKLVSTGRAKRMHGGIFAYSVSSVPEYLARTHILSPIKAEMAKLALQEIQMAGAYFIAASTTLVQMCEQIQQQGATVVTNSIDNAVALTQSGVVKIELLGGTVDKRNRYTCSLSTLSELGYFSFAKVFIGTSGVTPEGFYLSNKDDAVVIRHVVAHARHIIAVAEQYKFNSKKAAYKICSCKKIDTLITDSSLKEPQRNWFNKNIKIVIAKEEQDD